MSNKFVYFFAFSCVTVLWGVPENFVRATTTVVEDSPARLQALAGVDGYRAKADGFSRRYWPTVEVQSGYQISDSPVNVFMQRLSQRQFVQEDFAIDRLNHPGFHNDWASSIGASGLLWERGGLAYQQSAAEKLARSSELSAQALTGAILVNWTDLYFQALALDKSLAYVKTQISQLDQELDQSQRLEDQGVALGADVALAKAIREGLVTHLNDMKSQQTQTHARIKELLGSELTEMPQLSLLAHVGDASPSRPSFSVQAAQLNVAAAHDEIRASQLDNNLSLGWSVQQQSHVYGSASAVSTTAYLGFSWTVFDPQKASLVAAARSKARAQQAQLEASLRAQTRHNEELSAVLESLMASQNGLAVMYHDLIHSQEHLLPLYREGRKSIADLAQLRQKLAQAFCDAQTVDAAIVSTRVALVEAHGGLTLDKYLSLWK